MNDHIYLAHHGIKGQKWGVRRFRNEDGTLTEAGKRRYAATDSLTYEGGRRTQRLTNKLLKMDKRFGPQRTPSQQIKLNMQFREISKSYDDDLRKAESVGNDAAVRRLHAGRTYLKVLLDPRFTQMAINDSAVRANVKAGETFTYNFFRDDDFGGIAVTVNGVTSKYRYYND